MRLPVYGVKRCPNIHLLTDQIRVNYITLCNVMYMLALYYSGERPGIEMHVWPIKVLCVTTQRLPHGRKNPGLNWIETGRVYKWFAAALNESAVYHVIWAGRNVIKITWYGLLCVIIMVNLTVDWVHICYEINNADISHLLK